MRIDLALFQLRLFKSRSQATAAIDAGHVSLNGARVKPSHEIKAGDRVTLSGPGAKRTFEVLELPHASVSREGARALMRDVAG